MHLKNDEIDVKLKILEVIVIIQMVKNLKDDMSSFFLSLIFSLLNADLKLKMRRKEGRMRLRMRVRVRGDFL